LAPKKFWRALQKLPQKLNSSHCYCINLPFPFAIMPIVPDFDRSTSFLDETNHLTSQMAKVTDTPDPKMPPSAIVSPSARSNGSSVSSASSVSSEEDISSSLGKAILQSDHKKAEIAGRFVPEPLLIENPNRFVLFPIQDNEVNIWSVLLYTIIFYTEM
jgi:hypothetical protein